MRTQLVRLAALLGALALLLQTSAARADGGPKFGSGTWMPLGVTLGGAFRDQPTNGLVFGGEVSVVYLWMEGSVEGMWLGGVADAAYDFGAEGFRHRIGPEIGWQLFGIELAYVGLNRDDDGYRPGINPRAVVSLAFVSLYGGYGHLFGEGPGADYGEFGGLVKFPIPLDVDSARPYPPPPPPQPPPQPIVPDQSSPPPNQPLVPVEPAPADQPWATPPPAEPAPPTP